MAMLSAQLMGSHLEHWTGWMLVMTKAMQMALPLGTPMAGWKELEGAWHFPRVQSCL